MLRTSAADSNGMCLASMCHRLSACMKLISGECKTYPVDRFSAKTIQALAYTFPLNKVNKEIDDLQSNISSTRQELRNLTDSVSGQIETDVADLQESVKSLKNTVSTLDKQR